MMLILYLIVMGFWTILAAQDNFINPNINLRNDVIKSEPTYMIVASKIVRPNQIYRVMVTTYQNSLPVKITAFIQRDGIEIAKAEEDCEKDVTMTLLLKIPPGSIPGVYKLKIERTADDHPSGTDLINESILQFHQRSMTIFIQTDRPVYMQGQTVKFRAVPVTTDLKAFPNLVDVHMLNPNGVIVRRWLSRQTNFGAVTLTYALSQQPVYGNWTIQVKAEGQIENATFLVEEYYQTRFEVNVTMPAFIVDTEQYIHGSVMANYTSGIPISGGNLTLVISIESLHSYYQIHDDLPSLRQTFKEFEGYIDFRISMYELEELVPKLDRSKVTVTAIVGERFLSIYERGFAQVLISSSYTKLKFLGSSPQIFKPLMPFTAYVVVSNHDDTRLPAWRLKGMTKLDIIPTIYMHGGGQRKLDGFRDSLDSRISTIRDDIWQITVNLESEIRNRNELYRVQYMTLEALYYDESGEEAKAELKVYSTFTQSNSQLQVTTSTKNPKVGEYIIFHVRADYYVEKIYYIVISKGIILLTGQEPMTASIKTFAVPLSPEMAPTASILIYNIARNGEVIADSLTFPVDGISRNNFSVTLNNQKDKTGDTIEVIVRGRPGSYVGLAALDKTLYDMQTGNELSHIAVLQKMNSFDIGMNNTHSFTWYSKAGKAVRVVHFPSLSYGIDANRTFEYAGLLVFTDANITKKYDNCNISMGFAACLDGSCYSIHKRCDNYKDCVDGSDESGCTTEEDHHFANFRMNRINRIQRLYDNSWLWENINIGPLGYHIFNVPVPQLPVQWVVSAFGVNNNEGFGLMPQHLEFSSLKPFYMNVEMPQKSRQGEQIGIRISIFNYLMVEIEVLVILENSPDYKFVHVEAFGIVSAYNPRTSFGEHQHLIFIKPAETSVVYMPIVPTRVGDINVTITVKTQVAKDSVTKLLHVTADGITQYRHTSLLFDLSQGANLIKYLDTNITADPVIPLQPDRLYVLDSNQASLSVVGDVIGPTFPTMPVNSSVLLRKPSWCGEQNMFNFAVTMFMLQYLRFTGQREADIEKQAFFYLNKDYQQQLSYQLDNGAFAPFELDKTPSVWLTAFCIRIFNQITKIPEWEPWIYIDPDVISRAVDWLIQHQTPEGSFYETSLFPLDRKMNLSSKFPNDNARLRNISLTAHVLITLEEVKTLQQVSSARNRAKRYLESSLNIVKRYTDPYELAIVAYALTVTNSADGSEAFNLLNSQMRDMNGMKYWGKEPVPPIKTIIENNKPFIIPRLPNNYDASNIETTAYALLTYTARQAVIQKEIVEWLNSQRLTDGGWASTQDTVVALEALVKYAVESRMRDVIDLKISVEVRDFNKTFLIGKDDIVHGISKLRKVQIPHKEAWGVVIIQGKGSGIACVQLSTQYNVDWAHLLTPPPIKAFELDIRPRMYGRNNSHITFNSCQRWILTEESEASGMTVLEVDVPTGYMIQQQTLHSYVRSGQVRNLREARFLETKVFFYFNYLDSRETCLSFTIERWYPVANMTRYISARVYDYYAPERFNESMMEVLSLYYTHICQVCGSYQCPYCPIFSWSSRMSYNVWVMVLCMLIASKVFL